MCEVNRLGVNYALKPHQLNLGNLAVGQVWSEWQIGKQESPSMNLLYSVLLLYAGSAPLYIIIIQCHAYNIMNKYKNHFEESSRDGGAKVYK